MQLDSKITMLTKLIEHMAQYWQKNRQESELKKNDLVYVDYV